MNRAILRVSSITSSELTRLPCITYCNSFDDYYYDDGDDGDDNGDGDGDAGGGGAADDDDNDGDDEEEEDDDNFDDLDKTSVRRRWVASRPETWRFIPNKEPTKYSIPFGKLT